MVKGYIIRVVNTIYVIPGKSLVLWELFLTYILEVLVTTKETFIGA